MKRPAEKRTVDMHMIGDWVVPGSRVLDLGCGRGALLAWLAADKQVAGIGVDMDFHKISDCVRHGVTAYQGDMLSFMREFPDGHFDRVICSRTLQELADPTGVILEALRVGRTVTVSFVNHGFWKNRFDTLFRGRKTRNAVYTTDWFDSPPSNPLTIVDFEHFCAVKKIRVNHRAHLLGDWKTPCPFLPNLFAGYALYELCR